MGLKRIQIFLDDESVDTIKVMAEAEERSLSQMAAILLKKQLKKKQKKKAHVESTNEYSKVVEMYNRICVSYPRLRSLSAKRKQMIKSCMDNRSMDELKEVFVKAEASDFMKGINDRKWRATFDWMMNDNNMAKILDGNYDNKGAVKKDNGRVDNSLNVFE